MNSFFRLTIPLWLVVNLLIGQSAGQFTFSFPTTSTSDAQQPIEQVSNDTNATQAQAQAQPDKAIAIEQQQPRIDGISGQPPPPPQQQFPPIDPKTIQTHSPSPSQERRQMLHLTFVPMQNGRLLDQSKAPMVHAETRLPAADLSQRNLPLQDLHINPGDIQFSIPDLSDAASAKIIEQIRTQLGDKPMTIGDLNTKFINFSANMPGVLINRTMVSNVEEQVVDQIKTSRMTTAGTVYPPIQSYNYNPAAPPAAAVNHYQKPTYQVPTYPSLSAYQQAENAYQAQTKPPTYQPATNAKKESGYQAKNVPQYKATMAPPPPAAYQQPPPPQQPPSYKQQQSSPPQVIIKYVEVCSCPPPLPPPPQQMKQVQYQPPAPPAAAQAAPAPAAYNGAVSQAYGGIASALASANQDYDKLNDGKIVSDIAKASSEAQAGASEGYDKMAEIYAQIQEKMAQLEQLRGYAQQMQTDVGYGYQAPALAPAYQATYQQSPNPGVQVTSYHNYSVKPNGSGYKATTYTTKNEYKTTTATYNGKPVMASLQMPPPPQPQYSTGSYQSKQPNNYAKSSSMPNYAEQQQQSKQYSAPAPASKYTPASAAKSYEAQPPPPNPAYTSSNLASQLNYPQDGNNVRVSYHKVEEKIQTNETIPQKSASAYGNGGY